MKLLVHACCGPCSIMPTRLLAEQGHDITAFYANSNIAPQGEYEKRLRELQRYASDQGFEVLEGRYDPGAWEREVAPIGEALKNFSPAFGAHVAGEGAEAAGQSMQAAVGPALSSQSVSRTVPERASASQLALRITPEHESVSQSALRSKAIIETVLQPAPQMEPSSEQTSQLAPKLVSASAAASAPQTVAELLDDENRRERCRACYRLRLEEAARVAAEGGYDGLATTLAVSPYQFTDVIREELQRACGETGIVAHFQDYRPYYDEATRISRELGMYRQNYCGCRFSVVEGEATRAFIKQKRAEVKQAKAKAHADEEAARQRQAAEKRAEKQAYANERARRRVILKQMRGK